MLTGMEMMNCPNLAVPAEVMQHIVNVESSRNPYAIGVVGGQLVRQPQNLDEALSTVNMLESKGYNFSLGLAQVNRFNLSRYGLSYEQAFDTCSNLSAGSRILAQCYTSSGGDWGKSFSCYYSGNFVTGYTDGYVQKVYDSINRSTPGLVGQNVAAAIPLVSAESPSTVHGVAAKASVRGLTAMNTDNAAYRVAIRSALLDTIGNAAVSRATNILPAAAAPVPALESAAAQAVPAQAAADGAVVQSPATQATASAEPVDPALVQPPAAQPITPSTVATNTTVATTAPSMSGNVTAKAPATPSDDDIFVPQVRGPNDPPQAVVADAPVTATTASTASTAAAGNQTAVSQGGDDNAFVF